jgi:hypothetical protein
MPISSYPNLFTATKAVVMLAKELTADDTAISTGLDTQDANGEALVLTRVVWNGADADETVDIKFQASPNSDFSGTQTDITVTNGFAESLDLAAMVTANYHVISKVTLPLLGGTTKYRYIRPYIDTGGTTPMYNIHITMLMGGYHRLPDQTNTTTTVADLSDADENNVRTS